jgi:hypothetical protein
VERVRARAGPLQNGAGFARSVAGFVRLLFPIVAPGWARLRLGRAANFGGACVFGAGGTRMSRSGAWRGSGDFWRQVENARRVVFYSLVNGYIITFFFYLLFI